MPDDRSQRGPADASRVNVHEDYEVAYWTNRFGISAEQRKEAVKAVGPGVKAIETWLAGKK